MSDIAIPLIVAAASLVLTLAAALAVARRRRRRVRELLQGQLGLNPVGSVVRIGRTEWFEGHSGDRGFVGGLINLSGPDGGGGRRHRQSVCIVMPVDIEAPIGSISHRGKYTKSDQLDRFATLFRFSETSDPPNGNIRKALTDFSEVHGRINLWTRRRGQLMLPENLFPDSSHLLLWLGPRAPAAIDVTSAAEGLCRVAGEISDE
jgi:hypothetical protein